MRVRFVRHGESEMNVSGIANADPSLPFHLTQEGRRQAEELAWRLRGERIDAVFSSPLLRATETAHILKGNRRSPLIVDDRLGEVRWGRFEGKCFASPAGALAMCLLYLDCEAFGIESPRRVRERVVSFLESLAGSKYRSVLVVTHGLPIVIARSHFERLPLRVSMLRGVRTCGLLEYSL
jgi:broad specificity phosphatase PhoE